MEPKNWGRRRTDVEDRGKRNCWKRRSELRTKRASSCSHLPLLPSQWSAWFIYVLVQFFLLLLWHAPWLGVAFLNVTVITVVTCRVVFAIRLTLLSGLRKGHYTKGLQKAPPMLSKWCYINELHLHCQNLLQIFVLKATGKSCFWCREQRSNECLFLATSPQNAEPPNSQSEQFLSFWPVLTLIFAGTIVKIWYYYH